MANEAGKSTEQTAKPAGKDAPAAKNSEAPKAKVPTIGSVAVAAIKNGLNNEEVLKKIKAQFPEAKTQMASVNWYRNDLRSKGEKGVNGKPVPTSRELNKAKTAAKKAEETAKKEEAKKKADKEKAAKEKAAPVAEK